MRKRRIYAFTVEDRDPIAEQQCANCGAMLPCLGHLDGGRPDGTRFNVLLWECGNCGGRYSGTTDLTDSDSLARVVPEPWLEGTYWPG